MFTGQWRALIELQGEAGLTSLPLTLTAKKSTKIKFSNDKIYCNSYHRVPNIINM